MPVFITVLGASLIPFFDIHPASIRHVLSQFFVALISFGFGFGLRVEVFSHEAEVAAAVIFIPCSLSAFAKGDFELSAHI